MTIFLIFCFWLVVSLVWYFYHYPFTKFTLFDATVMFPMWFISLTIDRIAFWMGR